MSYSIILPTLNEEGHIIDLIKEIGKNFIAQKLLYEIIVVDDNSTDGTIEKVTNFIKISNIEIKLYVRKEKKNLAASINFGIDKSKYENIIWMDADFQHPPEYIKKLFQYVNDYDVIIFSRFLKESKRYFEDDISIKESNENQSILFNRISNLLIFKEITDYTSGFICIKKKLIEELKLKLKGFYGEYFVDLIVSSKLNNYRILELPFKEKIRKTGNSKTTNIHKLKYLIRSYFYFLIVLKNCLRAKLNFKL
tara:strand:- start:75 stop:830 length:756 start_codon:yes stop_codon:yes gene_type:complete